VHTASSITGQAIFASGDLEHPLQSPDRSPAATVHIALIDEPPRACGMEIDSMPAEMTKVPAQAECHAAYHRGAVLSIGDRLR